MTKIGFCFLSYHDIEQVAAWSDFFEAVDPQRYSVFVHRADGKRSTWCTTAVVIPYQETKWGTFSLVKVQQALLDAAYEDESITKFIFLSGDSIPLFSFNRIYEQITVDANGWLSVSVPPPNSVWARRELTVHSEKWPRELHWRWAVASQWCVFNRAHVQMLHENWGMLSSVFGKSTIPDEHLYGVFFFGVGVMDTFHPKSCMYVDFQKATTGCKLSHHTYPTTFHSIKESEVKLMYESGSLFARKICRSVIVQYDWGPINL